MTDFNNPELPCYKGKVVVAADHSLSPDGKRLVAYLQLNLLAQEGPIVLIEFDGPKFNPEVQPVTERRPAGR